ncbi:hypothetical protein JXA48_03475 [Candidatus Woesearchaeota archaeon]|nr:hypothetical protein [Candidatus Woesearchaeota archaeon]
MKTQMPIKKEQVEQLIGGVVAGYNGLVNMSGLEQDKSAETDIFVGVSTVGLRNQSELGKIVNNMFSFGLKDVFQANDFFKRQIEGAGVPSEEQLTALLNTYKTDVNNTREKVNNYLNAIEQRAEIKVEAFKDKVELLNLSLQTKKVQTVADALESIAELAGWNAEVNTKSVYDAGKAIGVLAQYNSDFGFNQANKIVVDIASALNQSHVRNAIGYNPFSGKLIPGFVKSAPDQTYKGNLDVELIATEMVRKS